ncbi:hypothetical protein GQ600_17390 [Phytophthora cactorum]|nr:hypothetical protein GQ600_17390 [Phytophthora cactorum]
MISLVAVDAWRLQALLSLRIQYGMADPSVWSDDHGHNPKHGKVMIDAVLIITKHLDSGVRLRQLHRFLPLWTCPRRRTGQVAGFTLTRMNDVRTFSPMIIGTSIMKGCSECSPSRSFMHASNADYR